MNRSTHIRLLVAAILSAGVAAFALASIIPSTTLTGDTAPLIEQAPIELPTIHVTPQGWTPVLPVVTVRAPAPATTPAQTHAPDKILAGPAGESRSGPDAPVHYARGKAPLGWSRKG